MRLTVVSVSLAEDRRLRPAPSRDGGGCAVSRSPLPPPPGRNHRPVPAPRRGLRPVLTHRDAALVRGARRAAPGPTRLGLKRSLARRQSPCPKCCSGKIRNAQSFNSHSPQTAIGKTQRRHEANGAPRVSTAIRLGCPPRPREPAARRCPARAVLFPALALSPCGACAYSCGGPPRAALAAEEASYMASQINPLSEMPGDRFTGRIEALWSTVCISARLCAQQKNRSIL